MDIEKGSSKWFMIENLRLSGVMICLILKEGI